MWRRAANLDTGITHQQPEIVQEQFERQESVEVLEESPCNLVRKPLRLRSAIEVHVNALAQKPVPELSHGDSGMKRLKQLFSQFKLAQHAGPVPGDEVETDAWTLRKLFNEGDFVTRRQQGLLQFREIPVNHTKPRDRAEAIPNGQYCMWSKLGVYLDPATQREQCLVHYYERPDGVIAASGMQDPKRLVVDGVVYKEKRGSGETPPVSQRIAQGFLWLIERTRRKWATLPWNRHPNYGKPRKRRKDQRKNGIP